MTVNKAQEKLLLLRIQKGKDPKAFERFYDLIADDIYRFIYFKVGQEETAQDITADVFMKLWEHLTVKETQVRHLRAFTYVIARTSVIDHYRTSKPQAELSEEIPDHSTSVVDTIELKLNIQQIMLVVEQLKDSYQEILILKHLNELTLKEIAQIIDKSPGATRVQLHRAQEALKRAYEKATN